MLAPISFHMDFMKLLLFLLPFHLHLFKSSQSKCDESFECGDYSMSFPYTRVGDPGCGLVAVEGCEPDSLYPIIRVGGGSLGYGLIMKNNSVNNFSVFDHQLDAQLKNRSCFSFNTPYVFRSPSVWFTISPNITLFSCSPEVSGQLEERFRDYRRQDCGISMVYYKIPASGDSAPEEEGEAPYGCIVVQLPMNSSRISSDSLFDIVTANYSLGWNVSEECVSCFHGGGQCLTDNEEQFYCKKGNTKPINIFFIVGMMIAALTSALMIAFVFVRMKRAKARQERDRDIELFLKNNGNLAPMRYKYSTIKSMTKSFGELLGRGGFSSVYKGKMADGHLVAVKVLNESNENGEDFMNEVASISRTSHVNIVALLGFCFEGSRRALIYDFMPNGSLEKFIDNNASSSQESGLGLDKLFEIVLGIARGLEYLHQGCNTRILHLDIKPQNILLDKDMNPRISDFGLAKLCPNRSSIVSIMVARGTIGYIAPEVFSRNFGEVSYKSDVYSYGMLVLEMVGGRRSIDPRDVDRSSEVYFPHYLYKQLEMNAEWGAGTMNEEEDESSPVKRNLIIVGLWCIQTNPKDRPTMTKVVEMLEGKVGSLEVPPKPYLYSPPRSPPSFSNSESL